MREKRYIVLKWPTFDFITYIHIYIYIYIYMYIYIYIYILYDIFDV